MAARILLVDDHIIVRQGLRMLLEQQPGLKVLAEAADGDTAVKLARQHRPDLVVMDITLPKMNGIEATKRILAAVPTTKVIALSMHSDRRFVLEMLKSGAKGYLLKDSAFDEMAEAIKAVSNGKTYLSAQITDLVVQDAVSRRKDVSGTVFSILTPREREVLQLLAEGRTTKETAAQLGVSVKTIETHRKQLMDKLNVHSVAELTKYAVREGLTTL
jgi:RNA polymerase sigma factor (sigma-70 family)